MRIQNDERGIKSRAFAVLDTNVLVSGIKSSDSGGYIQTIIKMVEDRQVIPLFDSRILSEYYGVLNRKRFGLNPSEVDVYLEVVLHNGIYVNDVQKLDTLMKDQSDVPFYEVVMDTAETNSYLVTGNIKHYPDESFIVTPKEFIGALERFDFMLRYSKDDDIDRRVDDIILKLVGTPKYTLGKALPEDFVREIRNEGIKAAGIDER